MQQVLITGATGFIGGNLARALAQRGYRVKVLVRSTEKAVVLLEGSQVHIVKGDITDPGSLERAVEPGDIVVHLAARYNDPAASYEMYHESNVVGTENLIRACQAKLVWRFVHCSTIGVAINSGKPPFDENSPYSPDSADPYEVTKCEGEQLVLKYYREQGFAAVVVRPVQPFGPGDLKKLKFYRLVKKGFVIGDGKVSKHLIYIADLVDAFEVAMRKNGIEGQIFIIGGKPVVTLAEMTRWAAEDMNVKTPRRIPAFPVQILTPIVETVCKRLKIKPPLYKSRLEFFTKSYYFDTSKAESMLDFKPQVSIREGMARTVDWYRQQGLL